MGYKFKKSDALDLARYLGCKTHEKGNELFFEYCPRCKGGRHDKNTFSINMDNGTFNCFRSSCGYKGHFVELARDFNFKLEFDNSPKRYKKLPQKPIVTKPAAVRYLESRGISEDVAKKYNITTTRNNDNILVFPFYDEQKMLQFVKYRNTKYNGTGNKEWCEKDTKPILFGMAQCADFKRLIITEGQIDSLSVSECGIDNAVSVPTGAQGFTWLPFVWDWILKFKEILVFGDFENGSMSLLQTLQQRLPQKIKAVRECDYLGEKDANAILCKYGKDAVINAVKNAEIPKIANVKDLSTVKAVDENKLPKIKTGITELDKVIGGLILGQLIILSGKRGNGKSTFMSQLVCEALEQDYSIFAYFGELADFHFKRWLDYQLAGANNVATLNNEYGEPVYTIAAETVEKINEWYKGRAFIYDNNYIDDSSQEMDVLTTTIETVIKQYDCKLICIDNLMTAMECVGEQNALYLAQSNFVGKLKKIAVKYNVVVILVAHPRKSKENFNNDEVSGSSDVTNKADIVLNYERVENEEYDGKISVTKNRLFGRYAYGDNAIKLLYSKKTKRISGINDSYKRYGWEKSDPNDVWEKEGFIYSNVDLESLPFEV